MRITIEELESYLWGAATILRGLVEAGDYKQYIFPLLFYKRLSDVWDEEYAGALADTGDAPWTNKSRLPDATLRNLLEHFSKHTTPSTRRKSPALCRTKRGGSSAFRPAAT